jgi:hypothetical protein
VLILALAKSNRPVTKSAPEAGRGSAPPPAEPDVRTEQKQSIDSAAIPKRRWYRWDLGLLPIPLFFGILLDPFGIISYLSGLINVPLVAFAFFAYVPLVPVAFACLVVLLVRMLFIWPKRIRNRGRLLLCWAAVVGAFVVCFVLPFTSVTPRAYKMFACGFKWHVQMRTDIPAIQAWLSTLDPNDCEGQPLNVSIAPGVNLPDPPRTIPEPEAIARLGRAGTRLLLDDTGYPMVRLTWGGGFIGHWGLVVGSERMKSPETQPSRWVEVEIGQTGRKQKLYEYGEYRSPLVPGAYVWYELE